MKNTVLLSLLSTPTGNPNEGPYSPIEEALKERLWLIQTTSFRFQFQNLKPLSWV